MRVPFLLLPSSILTLYQGARSVSAALARPSSFAPAPFLAPCGRVRLWGQCERKKVGKKGLTTTRDSTCDPGGFVAKKCEATFFWRKEADIGALCRRFARPSFFLKKNYLFFLARVRKSGQEIDKLQQALSRPILFRYFSFLFHIVICRLTSPTGAASLPGKAHAPKAPKATTTTTKCATEKREVIGSSNSGVYNMCGATKTQACRRAKTLRDEARRHSIDRVLFACFLVEPSQGRFFAAKKQEDASTHAGLDPHRVP